MVLIKRISFLQITWLTIVFSSMLIQQSCIKDEFTRPVRISLSVSIAEQYKTSDSLSFEDGEIIINEIEFNGQREVGPDYSFISESGKKFGPQAFYPQSMNQGEISHFDLPQGVYTFMKWRFELSQGLAGLEQDDNGENDIPGLILNANYVNNSGETIKIRVEIDPFESFECLSENPAGEKTITILSGNIYNAVMFFDPYFAFRPISRYSLDDADFSGDDISPVLLISSDSNEELYEIILFRLQQSARIVVS